MSDVPMPSFAKTIDDAFGSATASALDQGPVRER